MSPRRTVALYGGSFNPPHVAHVLGVAWVLSATDVDAVWIEPVDAHVFGKSLPDLDDRLEMCRRAFALFGARVEVRADERRPGATGRTLDLVAHLQARHPDVDFRLILGSDLLHERHKWHAFDEILRRAPPVVLGRPGYAIEPAFQRFAAPVTLPDVSSTAVRALLRRGGDATGLVPAPVLAWLRQHPLYTAEPTAVPTAQQTAEPTAEPGARADPLGRVAVVGAGRAGCCVAAVLAAGGVPVQLVCRGPERRAAVQAWLDRAGLVRAVTVQASTAGLQADTVIVAAPDRALADVAAELAATQPVGGAGQVWLHLSGVHGAAALRVPAGRAALGALHPLCALPDPVVAATPPGQALHGALLALDAEPAAELPCRALAALLGGQPWPVPAEARADWHAAAALVANDLVGLLEIGASLCARAGVPAAVAGPGLVHLARTALDAVASLPPDAPLVQGLTGAVARGDAATLARHFAALADLPDGRAAHAALSRLLTARLAAAGLQAPERTAAVLQAIAASDETA